MVVPEEPSYCGRYMYSEVGQQTQPVDACTCKYNSTPDDVRQAIETFFVYSFIIASDTVEHSSASAVDLMGRRSTKCPAYIAH